MRSKRSAGGVDGVIAVQYLRVLRVKQFGEFLYGRASIANQ
jgi:hypothetical protein